jgi:hypothetical protein
MYDPTTKDNYMALDLREDEYTGTIFAFAKGTEVTRAQDTVMEVVQTTAGKIHASHTSVLRLTPKTAGWLMKRGYLAFDVETFEQLSLS